MSNQRQYALGNDKCLLRVDSPLIGGWEEVKDLKQLMAYVQHPCRDDVQEGMEWKGSKIPKELMENVLGTIHEFPHRETGYILCYRLSDNTWDIECPEQSGSGGGVSFHNTEERTDGYTEVGTIHTHPEMGAFWSGTDRRDQEFKYGVHIVFGTKGGLVDTSLCSIFTPNGQHDIPIDTFTEDVDFKTVHPPVDEWVERIKAARYRQPITKFPGYEVTGTSKSPYFKHETGGIFGSYSRLTGRFENDEYICGGKRKDNADAVEEAIQDLSVSMLEMLYEKLGPKGLKKALEEAVPDLLVWGTTTLHTADDYADALDLILEEYDGEPDGCGVQDAVAQVMEDHGWVESPAGALRQKSSHHFGAYDYSADDLDFLPGE